MRLMLEAANDWTKRSVGYSSCRCIIGLGCTSIIAEDDQGRIWHGRNLDYEMSDLLKNITIIVDFRRGFKNATLVMNSYFIWSKIEVFSL
uniref:CBAH domain-containing protein n=1 Tax=Heterorhabditis bacteriophora TaxID=37862 RepID=A0A1I7WTI2_HETBA